MASLQLLVVNTPPTSGSSDWPNWDPRVVYRSGRDG